MFSHEICKFWDSSIQHNDSVCIWKSLKSLMFRGEAWLEEVGRWGSDTEGRITDLSSFLSLCFRLQGVEALCPASPSHRAVSALELADDGMELWGKRNLFSSKLGLPGICPSKEKAMKTRTIVSNTFLYIWNLLKDLKCGHRTHSHTHTHTHAHDSLWWRLC